MDNPLHLSYHKPQEMIVLNKEAEGLIAQLTMFQFQPNTSVAVASIRIFCFSVLNNAVIYKTTFVI